MALRARTFASFNEMKDFLEDNELGPEDIFGSWSNSSGWIDVLYDDAGEVMEHESGAAGTVTPGDGARIHQVWAVGGVSSQVEIFGGTAIPLPANTMLDLNFSGKLVGDGAETIVFTNTTSYVVTYIDRG